MLLDGRAEDVRPHAGAERGGPVRAGESLALDMEQLHRNPSAAEGDDSVQSRSSLARAPETFRSLSLHILPMDRTSVQLPRWRSPRDPRSPSPSSED